MQRTLAKYFWGFYILAPSKDLAGEQKYVSRSGRAVLTYLLTKSTQKQPPKLVKNIPENYLYTMTNSVTVNKITWHSFPFGGQLNSVRNFAFFLFKLGLNTNLPSRSKPSTRSFPQVYPSKSLTPFPPGISLFPLFSSSCIETTQNIQSNILGLAAARGGRMVSKPTCRGPNPCWSSGKWRWSSKLRFIRNSTTSRGCRSEEKYWIY
jgi:hypothetical protein